MTVNKLIQALRKEQKEGNGALQVHILAHDNCLGETQCCVHSVSYYEKPPNEDPKHGGRDALLYESLPDKVIYLH